VLKPKAASSEDATGVKKTLVASDPVADLTREIDVVLSGHDHFNNKPEKHPRSDDDDPSAGAASTAHKLVRKVKDLLPAPIGDSDLRL
jgi:hypothetical protein